jgi:hypothetical protein
MVGLGGKIDPEYRCRLPPQDSVQRNQAIANHRMERRVTENGSVHRHGLRVRGLVIWPYAKRGHIDHQQLSFDAYLKFIEDAFLGGQRLDPHTDGRPDPVPTSARTRAASVIYATTSTSTNSPAGRCNSRPCLPPS